MHKKLLFLIFLLIIILFPTKVSAQQDFYVDAEVEYDVQENGKTLVTFDLSLINANADLYAESYKLKLISIDPENVKAFYRDREVDIKEHREGEVVTLSVDFDDVVVGFGSKRVFTIYFEDGSFAEKSGEVWEISIPRVEGNNVFRDYTVTLVVPESFGEEAFVSPAPKETVVKGQRTYSFTGRKITNTGINAAFGKFQVFSFTLNYHLENPVNKRAYVDIALPPDTAFQKLYYQKIEPVPENVAVDSDGNWLATYRLKPRQRLDVQVLGSVQIFSSPRKLSVATVLPQDYYLGSSEFWHVDDTAIVDLANDLKTPKRIYQYVSTQLTYDYVRVKPNVVRLGAKGALLNPDSAICMEFTDLFIALARAAGIPAREINGYAYTENPEIQPLSLVADVLHAWPEYWDEERQAWIPVDPTWASTTGGVDYFSKLDLRHFTFVIHGESATKPYAPGSYKLGPNPQKDVFVSFGQLPQNRNSDLEIFADLKNTAPFLSNKILVSIKNPGPSALYDIHPQALFDGIVSQENFISVLPPYSEYKIEVLIPYSLLGTKTPNEVKIIANGKEVSVPTFKRRLIVTNLITVTLILITITLIMLERARKTPTHFLKYAKLKSKLTDYAKSIKNKKILRK
ncbi:transglutaminase domain-containing protein [Patescibacteria group bacterium]|nr:transglutaminase domain-containing protein [Patescibacteria group bacterium]